ncbi:MAG TPA: phosphotransferase [Chloroflexota bacterium]|nr:phosphotransferase [Chloroflexota bacterium]
MNVPLPETDLAEIAVCLLGRHDQSIGAAELLGRGEQSVCYGAGDFAVLLQHSAEPVPDVRQSNSYPVQQWMSWLAGQAAVHTVEFIASGDDPLPYAVMRRIHGRTAAEIEQSADAQRAAWLHAMAAEVRKINSVRVEGFGEVVATAEGYRGRYNSWAAYLDACIAKYLLQGPLSHDDVAVRDALLGQGIVSTAHLERIAAQLETAKGWGTEPVLVHYDNRLANLVVEGNRIALVDWGLSYAGIGLPQELVKVTEAPDAPPPYLPMHAFLEGYGVPEGDWPVAIERGTLMLVLDGLMMTHSWASADTESYLGGIRGWLTSIRRICDEARY